MFARLSAATLLSLLPLLAVAQQTCSTGELQCCNKVTQANSTEASDLSGFLGLILDPTARVGLYCSGVAVAGGSGTGCNQQAVCCENNSFGGLISIGCNPINLNA